LKILSILVLLVYWSLIILAPVVAKDNKKNLDKIVYPQKKPI